jgi:hypothetical protein
LHFYLLTLGGISFTFTNQGEKYQELEEEPIPQRFLIWNTLNYLPLEKLYPLFESSFQAFESSYL